MLYAVISLTKKYVISPAVVARNPFCRKANLKTLPSTNCSAPMFAVYTNSNTSSRSTAAVSMLIHHEARPLHELHMTEVMNTLHV
jgi:hypothetical protein